MPVTQMLMSIDDFSIDLTPTAPTEVRDLCVEGANLLITATDLLDPSLDSDTIASVALFNGIIMETKNQRRSFNGTGMLGYLENEKGYAGIGLHADEPTWPATITQIMTNWFDGSGRVNGLEAGTAHSATATQVQNLGDQAYMPPVKGPLDLVMAMTGNEYRALPTGKVDYGQATSLFRSVPLYLLAPGFDDRNHGDAICLKVVDFDAPRSIRQFRDSGVVKAQDGVTGSASTSAMSGLSLHRWDDAGVFMTMWNGEIALIDTNDYGDVTAAAQAVADRFADYYREFSITVDEYAIGRFITPGDWVWVCDPLSGIVDLTNMIMANGRWVFPQPQRCAGYTWPVQKGMGVYVHNWDADPVLTRISPYVAFESGPTQVTIGEKPLPLVPPKYASIVG